VEYPCYQCRAEIQEGVAFCPHCGAPQIRVAAPDNGAATPADSDNSGNVFPPLQSGGQQPSAWSQGGLPYPPGPGAIRWDVAWRGALLCGVGAAVLTTIPFVSIGCLLWMLGAGALCVSLYQRRVPDAVITPGMGMKLGALAGLFGFLVNAMVSTTSFVRMHASGDFRRAMEEQMQKQLSGNSDPKVQEMMQHMLDWVATPQGAATMIALVLVVSAAVFVLFSAAGGALRASLFRGRREFR
jgi:hypothetical protein